MSSLVNAQGVGGLIFLVFFGGFVIAYWRMWQWVISADGDAGDEE